MVNTVCIMWSYIRLVTWPLLFDELESLAVDFDFVSVQTKKKTRNILKIVFEMLRFFIMLFIFFNAAIAVSVNKFISHLCLCGL